MASVRSWLHTTGLALRAKRLSQTTRLRFTSGPVGINAGRCGFFGNLFMTLNGLRLCESAGVPGLPLWDERCLYHDPARGPNAWNYFYEPTLPPGGPEPGAWRLDPDAGVIHPRTPGLSVRQDYSGCLGRYARLLPEIEGPLAEERRGLLGDASVLAVHVRLTDAAAGFEGRNSSDLDGYFRAVDAGLGAGDYAAIFVATDSEPVVRAMTDRYGDRVATLDCLRSTGSESIHGHYDGGVAGSGYNKGLEVIRDAWFLASADLLVCSSSRVAAYALCVDPALRYLFVDAELDGARLGWLTEEPA